jgi:hypothetical protein
MLPNNTLKNFPRKLTDLEKEYLRKLLPIDREGYKYYHQKLDELYLIGKGRFNQDDFVLGKKDDNPDFSAPAESMLAVGKIITHNHEIEISIHAEFEEKIELDFSLSGNGEFNPELKSYWTYSEWLPGKNSPADDSKVREIHLVKNQIVVAIAPKSKRTWVYDANTGINHLLPVTNFYNEIMRVKNERDPKIALDVQRLYTHLDELKDEEIVQGFLMYNKYLNKIKIDYSLFSKNPKEEKKSIFKIFGGRKN